MTMIQNVNRQYIIITTIKYMGQAKKALNNT